MSHTHNRLILFDIDYTLFDTTTFKETSLSEFRLYDEVIPVLEQLTAYAELGIFSEGDIKMQKTKLAKTVIENHFKKDHIHISVKKIDSLSTIFPLYKGRDVYVVDDKASILFEIQKRYEGVKTIWVRRGPYAQNATLLPEFHPHATVDNLREILPIIREGK